MFNALLIAVSAVLIPQALAICSPGDIAIGEVASNITNPTNSATVWDSNCNFLDSKPGDFDICGSYEGGATVICNAGTETPVSAQLGDGFDFGNCIQDFLDTCAPSGRTLYCCSPAA